MEEFDITLKNYRAFSQQAPITFRVSEGITFFLGVNNVGKSALLRCFFELRHFVHQNQLFNARTVANGLDFPADLPTTFDRVAHRTTPSGPIEITFRQNDTGWKIVIHPKGDPHTQNCQAKLTVIGKPTDDFGIAVDALFQHSMYVGAFRSPAVEASGTLYDIEIGKRFVGQWDAWANGRRVDHSNQVELLVEELRSLFGFRNFSISVSQGRDQLDLKTDDGKFAIGELGDGIAHYIVVLGNAMIRRPRYIFMDEPEIGLHPRMQEIFVRALAAKAKSGLMATSHSIGLARSVADRIVTVTRDQTGRRRCLPFGEHRSDTLMQSISELGFSQYAEIGGNHLLLVEGRTDIKAFREILRKFGLEQHFLIWSLNGSDWLTAEPARVADELNEIKRLNARSYSVIFDSERTNAGMTMNPSFQPFYDLCVNLGFNVFPTDRHSTENYVTQAALDDAMPGQDYKALGEFEVFGATGKKWDKNKNWLLFQRMKAEDFDKTAMKEFITGTLKTAVEKAGAV